MPTVQNNRTTYSVVVESAVFLMEKQPASASKIGDNETMIYISYKKNFFKRFRGSGSVNYSYSGNVENVKGTVSVKNNYTDKVQIRSLMANSY